MRSPHPTLMTLLVLCVCAGLVQADLALVKNGQPTATIVLSERPTRSAQFAAYELQYYVKMITGAALPIVADSAPVTGNRVLVGESRATHALRLPGKPFEEEEYLIKFLPGVLVLMGQDERNYTTVKHGGDDLLAYANWPPPFSLHATCLAVYDLLDRCGVRWFTADDYGLVYPTQQSLRVGGGDLRRAPGFHWREPGYSGGGSYDACTRMWQYGGIGGAAKPEETPRFNAVSAMAWAQTAAKYPRAVNQAKGIATILFVLRSRAGGSEPFGCGHAFYGYYQRFWEKNPKNPSVWEGEHHEYFAQGYSGQPPQMCYTNPAFVQQAVQDARDYFDGKGTKFMSANSGRYFGLAAQDNRAWCKCDACQALLDPEEAKSRAFSNGWASDYIYNFVNLVAAEVAKSHPEGRLSTIAYASTALPPKHRRVADNVAVQLCLHTRNWYSESMKASDLRMLREWKQTGTKNLYLWEYWCFPRLAARGGNWRCFPGFFAHMAGDQYKLFHEAGIRGMFYEWFGQQTDAYVGLRMMDNPDLKVDDILDDYFSKYFGPAAQPMADFYRLVEERYSNPANYPKGFSGHQTQEIAWGSLGTKPVMSKLRRYMQQAQRLATADPYKGRVALFKADIWDYMYEGRQIYEEQAKIPMPSLTVKKIAAAGGDAARVGWDQLETVPISRHLGNGTDLKVPVFMRIAHDGAHLYLQLTDVVDPKTLYSDGAIFGGNDWELFWARERTGSYRQLGINPKGEFLCYTWGEEEKTFDAGVKVVSDTGGDRWVTTVVLRLAQMLPGGVASGDKLVANFYHIGQQPTPRSMLAWSPTFALFHAPWRFGEVTFE